MNHTRLGRAFEASFAVAALFLSTDALFPLLSAGGQGSGSLDPTGNGPFELAWLAIYAVAIGLLVHRRAPVRSYLASNRLLVALTFLAFASTAWSTDPGLTLRRSLAFALTYVFSVYLVSSFSAREVGTLIATVLALVIVLSICCVLFMPQYGLDDLRGNAWRGLFTTKNELGRVSALSFVIWLLRFSTRRGSRPVAALFVLLSLLTLARSDSRTAEIVTACAVLLVALTPAFRASRDVAVSACCGVVAAGILAFDWLTGHTDLVLGHLGSSPTLTGRSAIWDAVWTMIRHHLWFGYGYSSFWRGWSGPSGYVWSAVPSQPANAHNGFLDAWLDVGLVGVILLGAGLAVVLYRCFVLMRADGSFESLAPFVIVSFLMLYNVTEGGLMSRNSLYWLLILIAANQVAVRRAARDGVSLIRSPVVAQVVQARFP